jgi:hypothetical protein
MRILIIRLMTAFVLLVSTTAIEAAPTVSSPHVGDAYQVTLSQDSTEQGTDGSSGSSNDRDTIIERVIGVRPDGVELEYDFPKDTPKGERDSSWQFPARVFRPFNGPSQLIDRAGVEKRVDAWLKAANWTRAICGHWIFTWNAFRIDCDPDSVVKAVEGFELNSDVRDGALYEDPRARGPGVLAKKTSGPAGAFTTEMKINPDTVRRERAESEVATGEITNKPVTLDAALRKQASDAISGTITVTFDVDSQGNVWRRTKVTKLQVNEPDGKSKTATTTETLERHRISTR